MRGMHCRRVLIGLMGVVGLAAFSPIDVLAQDVAFTPERPRFLYRPEAGAAPIEVDVSRTMVLSRVISLRIDQPTIGGLLAAIEEQTELTFAYDNEFPASRPITFRADSITVGAALSGILLDTGVDVVLSRRGHAALVKARPRTDVQQGTIVGRVTAADSGTPIAAAQVVVDGRGRAFTDSDGRYRIDGIMPGLRTLSVTSLGYASASRDVELADGQTVTADFVLEISPTMLAEMVVTATGRQRRLEVGNVIASVRADSLVTSTPMTNLNDLLQGRVPGLQVYNAGGYTGATSVMRIRGTNSLTVSNDPIVIVDGIRIASSAGVNAPLGITDVSGTFRQFRPGRLADLSMREIESIDVVKGPSAATLYGSDAANGVIVIQTKRGTASPPRWRFWTEQGMSRPADHFLPGRWAYGTNLATGASQRCVLVQVAAGICRQDSIAVWNPLEDPATSPMATGRRQVYGAHVGGGVQNFTYFLSGQVTDETGYLRMPDAEQERIKELRGVGSLPREQVRPNYVNLLNLRANAGYSLGERGHIQLSNGIAFNTTAIPGSSIYRNGAIYLAPPTENNGWLSTRPGEQFARTSSESTTRFTSSVAGDYQLNSWLSMRGTVGLDASNAHQLSLQKNGEGPAATAEGQIQNNRYDIKLWSLDISGTATHRFSPSVTSRTTLGAQYNRRRELRLLSYGSDLTPGSTTLAGAAVRAVDESTTETIVAGGFAEQTVSFADRLFLNAAVRFDGGSAFGSAFKTIAYPKASVSWLAADGGTGVWPGWVDNLRLRAAIGSSGVQPGAVAARQRDCLAPALVNGANVTGATLCQLGNADLKPEVQTEFEAGVDAGLFGSRLNLEFTFYHRQSRDAIAEVAVAPSANTITAIGSRAGRLTVPMNIGSVRNRGIEFALNARVLDGPAASLDLGISANLNENRLLSLGEGVPFTPTSDNQPGYPLNSRFQRRYTYQDADGNRIITPDEITMDDEPSWMGPVKPQHVASGNVALGLFNERLRISAMGDYRGGSVIPNFTEVSNCIFTTCKGVTDPGASLSKQAAAQAWAAYGSYAGFFYSGRFLSVREISASYALPESWASRIGARGARLSVSARNVATVLTDCDCFSVESIQAIGADGLGPQNPGAPMPRYLIFGLTLDY